MIFRNYKCCIVLYVKMLWTISYYLVHIIFMTVVRITYDLQARMLNYMFRYARFLTLVMEYS